MLMSGATWLIYAMTTATEAPWQPVAVLQYGTLACAVGLIGSLAMFASQQGDERPVLAPSLQSNVSSLSALAIRA
jgi:hypothetical protein